MTLSRILGSGSADVVSGLGLGLALELGIGLGLVIGLVRGGLD